jgi:hypothetical protein
MRATTGEPEVVVLNHGMAGYRSILARLHESQVMAAPVAQIDVRAKFGLNEIRFPR